MTGSEDPRVVRSRAAATTAAIDLLVEGGTRAVTVDAVVARSGVAKTTIYRHWESRDELLLAALDEALPRPATPDTGSLDEDLAVLARALAAGLSHPRHGAILQAVLSTGPDGGAERAEGIDALRREFAAERNASLRTVLRRAAERGETDGSTRPDEVIRAIAGPLFYRRFVEGRSVQRSHADAAVSAALATLATPSSSPEIST
jgi:AcrR family transcriptional regulator